MLISNLLDGKRNPAIQITYVKAAEISVNRVPNFLLIVGANTAVRANDKYTMAMFTSPRLPKPKSFVILAAIDWHEIKAVNRMRKPNVSART